MDSKDRMKLIVAIVIFLAAGLLIAWNFGLFDGLGGGSSAPPPTPPAETPAEPTGGAQPAPVG